MFSDPGGVCSTVQKCGKKCARQALLPSSLIGGVVRSVFNHAKEDKTQISMSLFLLKAKSCHVAILSDANAVRTQKAPEFTMVAYLEIGSWLECWCNRQAFVFKVLLSLVSR